MTLRQRAHAALLLAVVLSACAAGTSESQQKAEVNYAAICQGIAPEEDREECERVSQDADRRLAGLQKQMPPPEAYLRPEDQERARRLNPDDMPCTTRRTEEGITIVSGPPTDGCVRMLPRQRYTGVWINEFEGSYFYPDRTTYPDTRDTSIWLDIERVRPANLVPDSRGYLIEFDGRRTMHPGLYGHLAVEARHELIVDQIISVRPLPLRSP